ncbi:MAG TPA: hypothetical protein VF469_04595 [Kofleriaceae bacterium]
MATKKTKKAKKAKSGHMLRNAAAPPRALTPRTTALRPRTPPRDPDHPDSETPGWRALKAAGGALATTVAGAYVARQDWLPPKVMTGLLSGLGVLLALEGPGKWKSLGLGAMSAAGGQLGFMLIDDQLIKHTEEKEPKEHAASTPQSSAPTKRQASDIPADALARAYERARLRMALTSDAPN